MFQRVFGHDLPAAGRRKGRSAPATLELLERARHPWAASSGNVLRGCLQAPRGRRCPNWPDCTAPGSVEVPGQNCAAYFRDDELSDLIGFTYSKLARRRRRAALRRANSSAWREDSPTAPAGTMVLIALDGENAWEHYPFNGYYFLSGLYAALADHPRLELRTLGRAAGAGNGRAALPRVRAGSWVNGTLATWIGESPTRTPAWDLLMRGQDAPRASARRARVQRGAATQMDRAAAGAVREFRLVLVVRRLQSVRGRARIRSACFAISWRAL